MNSPKRHKHIWIGPCGCYSDIKKPSWKPWFWKPQVDLEDIRSILFGRDEWKRNRLEILQDILSPIFFGGDEYCRTTIVIGWSITGRIIIPLWGHDEKTCGDCPMERVEGGSELDYYLTTLEEIRNEENQETNGKYISSDFSSNAKFAKEFIATSYNQGNPLPPEWAQVLNVVGEAGEFAEAYRRYVGHARREGNFEEVSQELADIVISAYITAERLSIDLDAQIQIKQETIMTRGFKDSQD